MVKERYTGIRVEQCEAFVGEDPSRYAKNVRIGNPEDLKPIVASRPMQRHQVDVSYIDKVRQDPPDIDADDDSVASNNEPYRYVVVVLDVYTR